MDKRTECLNLPGGFPGITVNSSACEKNFGMILVDVETKLILSCNSTAQLKLNVSNRDLVGKKITDFVAFSVINTLKIKSKNRDFNNYNGALTTEIKGIDGVLKNVKMILNTVNINGSENIMILFRGIFDQTGINT